MAGMPSLAGGPPSRMHARMYPVYQRSATCTQEGCTRAGYIPALVPRSNDLGTNNILVIWDCKNGGRARRLTETRSGMTESRSVWYHGPRYPRTSVLGYLGP